MARFTDYALWKMAMRGIERDEVELILSDPEREFASSESARHIYGRHVGGRLLYAVVEPFDHQLVVTVFVPDQEDSRK
jgi:hypothetical protein